MHPFDARIEPAREATLSHALPADVIAGKWVWCVENLGSQWTIEKVLVSHDSNEAVVEWTHWKRKLNSAQRGDEWYVFDGPTGLIREIRAYCAAPAVNRRHKRIASPQLTASAKS